MEVGALSDWRTQVCGIMLDVAMQEAVRVDGLVKRFGSVTAVDGISFDVKRGEIFGILGPNGAGKTTTLEIIEGLQKPSHGQVTVLGMNIFERPAQVKAKIGVQLQSSAYYDHLSLKEILSLLGSFLPHSVSARRFAGASRVVGQGQQPGEPTFRRPETTIYRGRQSG